MTTNHISRLAAACMMVAALALPACSFLDENPRSGQTENKILLNANDLYINAVDVLYTHLGSDTHGEGLQGTYRGIYDLQTFTSDEAIIPTRGGDWYDGGLWQQLYLHEWTDDNQAVINSWFYLYKTIVLCNQSLQMVDDYRHLLPNTTDYLRVTSEIRAVRALLYYYLLDLYGNVPIVTSTYTSTREIHQSSRSQVFRFVETELCEALPYLPIAGSQKLGSHYGHVTSAVAAFVLMKLALNAEIWLDDNHLDSQHPDGAVARMRADGDSISCWDAVEHYANLIALSGHRLDHSQSDCFAVNNENSNENIFTIPMDKNLYTSRFFNQFRSLHYQHGGALGYGGENGSCATIESLETFGYFTDEPDVRFHSTFFSDTVYVNGQPLQLAGGDTLVYQADKVELILTGSPYMATAGARMAKYVYDPSGIFDGTLRQNDIVLFRFADVLLSVAEAKVRNGKSGQTEFDLVRNRQSQAVYATDNTPRTATLDNILEERKLELMWEGWRRQDLIRFRQFVDDQADLYLTVFPIPLTAIQMNTNLKQNPGYDE